MNDCQCQHSFQPSIKLSICTQVSWAYEAAVLQRSGTSPQAGGATGATEPRDAWRRQQHSRRQHQWQHQQHSSEWQHRQDQSERVRSEHKRANAFIDRIKGSVLASAVLLCVLFSGTPSSRDDIFSPVRRMLGTQRDPKPAAAVFEMEVDEATNVAPGTQRHATYPAGWMAKAVEEEAQRYPKGYGSQPAHGAPMGAAGVALAKAAWLSRQSDEKYSTAVEDVMEAQRRAREGQPPQTRPLVTEESKATTPAGLQFGMAE